jgi:hypothetical protein
MTDSFFIDVIVLILAAMFIFAGIIGIALCVAAAIGDQDLRRGDPRPTPGERDPSAREHNDGIEGERA